MFKLLRRISSSIYPRPDRPWSDDATSNAPTIGRKRRLSDEDRDGDDVRDAGSSRKRRVPLEREDTSELGELRAKGTEIDPSVKEVTRGVKEVELEDKKEGSATDDDGKGTAAGEASTTPTEGESEPSVAPPHDPAPLPQGEGDVRPSTVPNDDEGTPIVHSEAIVEASSNDSPEESLAQVEDEKDSTDAAPAVVDDEVARAAELVDPSPELDTTTSSAEVNDSTLQEQPEQ